MGRRQFPWRLLPRSDGGKFLGWMLGSFLVVAAVNGALVWYALSTFSGLSTEEPYEKGLAYNQALAQEAAQKKLGWQVHATYENGHVVAAFVDRAGRPLDRLKVTVAFVRPTRAGFDRTATLGWSGNGRYQGDVALPLPGVWDLEMIGDGAAGHYQYLQRIFVK